MEDAVDAFLEAVALRSREVRMLVLQQMKAGRKAAGGEVSKEALVRIRQTFREHAQVGRERDVDHAFGELLRFEGYTGALAAIARALSDDWLVQFIEEAIGERKGSRPRGRGDGVTRVRRKEEDRKISSTSALDDTIEGPLEVVARERGGGAVEEQRFPGALCHGDRVTIRLLGSDHSDQCAHLQLSEEEGVEVGERGEVFVIEGERGAAVVSGGIVRFRSTNRGGYLVTDATGQIRASGESNAGSNWEVEVVGATDLVWFSSTSPATSKVPPLLGSVACVLKHQVSGRVLCGLEGGAHSEGRGGNRGVWALIREGSAFAPSWSRSRPALDALEALDDESRVRGDDEGWERMPREAQERMLVDDCLGALQGLVGSTTCTLRDEDVEGWPWFLLRVRFGLQRRAIAALDKGLVALAQRCLGPAATAVRCRVLCAALADTGAGAVAEAAAAAARELLSETDVLAAQLDSTARKDSLGLARLWFLVQPVGRALQALEDALLACALGQRGGGVVRRLHRLWERQGEAGAKSVLAFVLERAAEPLLALLRRWLLRGDADQGGEFFIDTNGGNGGDDETWDAGFSLIRERCPAFLEPVADRVLEAGKCVAALRRCTGGAPVFIAPDATHDEILARGVDRDGRPLWQPPGSVHLRFSPEARDYEAPIAALHSAATRALLRFLLEDSRLLSRLEAVRDLFLLRQGDYVSAFMDAAHAELANDSLPPSTTTSLSSSTVSDISTSPALSKRLARLRALLDLSIRAARPSADEMADCVICALEARPLAEQLEAVHAGAGAAAAGATAAPRRGRSLKVYAALTLDLQVAWPLSLVLDEAALLRYQLLFRHLFFTAYVGRALGRSWATHQQCKELNLGTLLAASWALRQRMLHLVHNLHFFFAVEVLTPAWHALEAALRSAGSLDAVRRAHIHFLDSALAGCLLSEPTMLRPLTRLVTLCLYFADRLTDDMDKHRPDDEEVAKRAGMGTPPPARRRRRTERGGGGEDDDVKEALRIRKAALAAKRRQARLQITTEKMRHTMAQAGWQDMIRKSEEHFDRYLEQFLSALAEKAALDARSPFAYLCNRLDFNGFYSRKFRTTIAPRPG